MEPMPDPFLYIGVDTGGTFTDLVLVDARRRVVATHKLLSTPADPAAAVLQGVDEVLAKAGLPPRERSRPRVVHGSTVATNALLEGRRETTVFITTAGFEDTLHIARQDRPTLYALVPRRPEPPVPRSHCLGVAERVLRDGRVLEPLTDAALADLVERVRALRPASAAISLLHGYANPAHERRVADALRDAFGDELHLTVAHELLPEHREYERAATCIVNAVVAPRMTRYIGRLARELAAGDADGGGLRIMASHGGVLPPARVVREPVRTILSGPAGGALGAAAMARAAGIDRVITLDMGGTSTDVALIDGEPTLGTEGEAADLPVRLPMIDLHTVGAGGGSIAWIDPGGALRVGPRSAGSDPGPACYGRQDPAQPPLATVTDAHVVLGHIREDQVLGAGLRIRRDLAERAVAHVAERAGLALTEAARGIHRVAEATMARAVQRISLQRGRDPRGYALLPFGGAGGLHACRLAESLGMRRVIVPMHPGLLSAVGMIGAPPRYTFSQAVLLRIEHDGDGYRWAEHLAAIDAALEPLRQRADAAMAHESIPAGERRDVRSADLRYLGQSYEITVPLDDGDAIEHFLAEHRRLYGYVAPGKPIELVTLRWQAGGVEHAVELPPLAAPSRPVETTAATIRGDGGDEAWAIVERERLGPGCGIAPRTILREYSATTLVPAGWSGRVDERGLILLERESTP